MISGLSEALAGMTRASEGFSRAASDVVEATSVTPSPQSQALDETVDTEPPSGSQSSSQPLSVPFVAPPTLERAIPDMMMAAHAYKAAAALARTAGDMQDSLLEAFKKTS